MRGGDGRRGADGGRGCEGGPGLGFGGGVGGVKKPPYIWGRERRGGVPGGGVAVNVTEVPAAANHHDKVENSMSPGILLALSLSCWKV